VDDELEVIRHQMEGTRASLADKLDTLENQVLDTVHDATAAVAHTVEDVKSVVGSVTESIQETVENVKETFNLSEHVRHHPWGMLMGAAATGFLGGWLIGPARREEETATAPRQPFTAPAPVASVPAKPAEPASEKSSLLEPLESLKGVALGALMGVLREMVTDCVPASMKADVVSAVDDFTTRLGGKPVPISEEKPAGSESSAEAANSKRGSAAAASPVEPAREEGTKEPAGRGRGRGGSRFR